MEVQMIMHFDKRYSKLTCLDYTLNGVTTIKLLCSKDNHYVYENILLYENNYVLERQKYVSNYRYIS
jgi:hypothetical protein